jgi:hydrogenase nickel incorporation protein HypA/HybF
MHELSVAREIVRIVEAERRKHGFDVVRAISVRAGVLGGIDRAALEFAFEIVREGTCVAEARLDVEIAEGTLTCRDCGHAMSAESLPEKCPGCGSLNLRLDGAAGLDVVSLEVD